MADFSIRQHWSSPEKDDNVVVVGDGGAESPVDEPLNFERDWTEEEEKKLVRR